MQYYNLKNGNNTNDTNEGIEIGKIFHKDFYNAFMKIRQTKIFSQISFLCVGTDRIIGDSYGPLVGHYLNKLLMRSNYSNINVYGTIENNLNYENINSVIKKINIATLVIVIDAALSNKENIGKIFVTNEKTILGKGLNKDKTQIGDISIRAVVGKDFKSLNYNFKSLQNVSLNSVMNLAEITAEEIYKVIRNI